MASRETSGAIPKVEGDATAGLTVARSEAGDVASLLSSRMTDIASEDGGEYAADSNGAQRRSNRQSLQTGTADGASRPNTGLTRSSSQRGAWSQAPPSRRGFAGSNAQRGSVPGSVSNASAGRPPSATSRSHVPSLTSHAFFRPMSSQRLQAQRGGSRPTTNPQSGTNQDGFVEGGSSVARNSVNSIQTAKHGFSTQEYGDGPPPPSRGTEMTEQETTDRFTANTSPTHDHRPTGSMSESERPLQRNPVNTKGLSLNIDKSYKTGGLPTPSKSPRSFRSSFLIPSRGDAAPNSPNRSTEGREKLESIASSPGLTPADAPKPGLKQKPGLNHEYFTGNTVFFMAGRVQNTYHKPINIATGLFVFVPGVLFYVFSAPWLWHHISPALPIIFAYIFYVCMSSFIHASVSDPGVSLGTDPLFNMLNVLTIADFTSKYAFDAST